MRFAGLDIDVLRVEILLMQPIELFSLESHAGPYEKWPLRTRLFADGVDSGQTVSGFVIEAQYRCQAGYLLITSYDCLYEAANTFTLLNDSVETIASTGLGVMYNTFLLEKQRPTSANSLELDYGDGLVYSLAIGSCVLGRPKLELSRLAAGTHP
jgi:hypothetical protein